jgi:lactate dehydrogenase-like 2-hydroxyacid dehydrogenase
MDVLLPVPMPPRVLDALASSFRVHRLWEFSDPEATLTELAPRVRALAIGPGHYRTDAAVMGRFSKLEIVASFGVGYDNVDVRWAAEHGIVITNTPDVLTEEVADTAMGLIVCAVRQLPQAERYLRAGRWLKEPFPLSPSLRGRTLGILGLGRIGKAIARRAEAFGLKIVYHGRNVQEEEPYLFFPTLVGMARAADILIVVAPGGPGTRNLVDREVLRALGPDGVLVNIARGSVVDEAALIAALRDREILAAGLDVFVDEPHVPPALLEMDNVVLLPHVGSASQPTRDAMGQLVVDNLVAWAKGEAPITPVPETPWRKKTKAAHSRSG